MAMLISIPKILPALLKVEICDSNPGVFVDGKDVRFQKLTNTWPTSFLNLAFLLNPLLHVYTLTHSKMVDRPLWDTVSLIFPGLLRERLAGLKSLNFSMAPLVNDALLNSLLLLLLLLLLNSLMLIFIIF